MYKYVIYLYYCLIKKKRKSEKFYKDCKSLKIKLKLSKLSVIYVIMLLYIVIFNYITNNKYRKTCKKKTCEKKNKKKILSSELKGK